jgi:hypothetical protein
MISLSTAKFLLFIALCLGPQYGDTNHTIEIVSKNSYVVWTGNPDGWTVVQKGQTADDWPTGGTSLTTEDLNQFSKSYADRVRAISNHRWAYGHHSALYFSNGDIVEKQGSNKVFYTVNAGSYNQQIFTIQTMANGKPL